MKIIDLLKDLEAPALFHESHNKKKKDSINSLWRSFKGMSRCHLPCHSSRCNLEKHKINRSTENIHEGRNTHRHRNTHTYTYTRSLKYTYLEHQHPRDWTSVPAARTIKFAGKKRNKSLSLCLLINSRG